MGVLGYARTARCLNPPGRFTGCLMQNGEGVAYSLVVDGRSSRAELYVAPSEKVVHEAPHLFRRASVTVEAMWTPTIDDLRDFAPSIAAAPFYWLPILFTAMQGLT
jgi:hypothetical protein